MTCPEVVCRTWTEAGPNEQAQKEWQPTSSGQRKQRDVNLNDENKRRTVTVLNKPKIFFCFLVDRKRYNLTYTSNDI